MASDAAEQRYLNQAETTHHEFAESATSSMIGHKASYLLRKCYADKSLDKLGILQEF